MIRVFIFGAETGIFINVKSGGDTSRIFVYIILYLARQKLYNNPIEYYKN